MATVLSPLTASNYGDALLMSGLQSQFGGRIAAKAAVIESDYGAKLGAVDRQARPWKQFQADLEKPRAIVGGAVGRLKGIRGLVETLINTVNKASLDPQAATFAEGYRATFDSILKSLRSRVDVTADSPNLLGNAGPRELAIPTGINGSTLTVSQSYKGTGYRIVDSEGNLWAPDYAGDLLRRYESYPEEPSPVSGSLASAVRLDAVDGDAVTLTIGAGTADPQTVTGTLERDGLGLVDAWFYDRLATDDGRNRALADLKAAKRTLDLEIDRYQRTLTAIDYYDTRTAIRLGDFRAKTGALLIERERAMLTSKEEMQRRFDLASTALARNRFALGVYKSMFGRSANTVADRVFGAIINTRA